MSTPRIGTGPVPPVGKPSLPAQSSNTVVNELAAYMERLVGHDLYCDTARRFQKDRHTQDSLRLTVWELTDDPGSMEYRERCSSLKDCPIPVCWYRFLSGSNRDKKEHTEAFGNVSVSTLSFDPLFPDSSASDLRDMEKIRAHFSLAWPDIMIVDHVVSRVSQDVTMIETLLNSWFHCVEPGGILITIDADLPELATFMVKNDGVRKSSGADEVWSLNKEPNIYEGHKKKVADRNKIFDQQTCKDAVVRTLDRFDLDSDARILDVGTGDGRFSRHVYQECQRRHWTYEGLEMSSYTTMRPLSKELETANIKYANFFCTNWLSQRKEGTDQVQVDNVAKQSDQISEPTHPYNEPQPYSAIFLFFVLHSLKFWPFYIFRAYELLKPGGYLALSFRDDNFCYWLHGVFDDSTKSPVKDAMKGYWDKRSKLGIRNYDQMYNVISPVQSLRFAERLGFEVADTVRVNKVREYEVFRQQFSASPEEPAYWNIARVGVTSKDNRDLEDAFQPSSVDDTLSETMVVFVLRKPKG